MKRPQLEIGKHVGYLFGWPVIVGKVFGVEPRTPTQVDPNRCMSHQRLLEQTNYGPLCRVCNEGVPGIEWPVIDSTEEKGVGADEQAAPKPSQA